MKAILISTKPRHCGNIANGIKTVEVRKTKPKLRIPFKVFIYCTKGEPLLKTISNKFFINPSPIDDSENLYGLHELENGKVIGEFVCDKITIDLVGYRDHEPCYWPLLENTCLSAKELMSYGKWKALYGWHISDLVIYDKPRELSDFITPSKIGCVNEGKCRGCKYLDRGNGYNVEDDCNAKFDTDEYKPLRRAPQSWCYVEV